MKISVDAFEDAVTRWKQSGARDGTHQRLGQYLMNVFFAHQPGISVPGIFYEEDWKKAYAMFRERFVDNQL